jgi:2-dehydro-3-deoxygalactonokinase
MLPSTLGVDDARAAMPVPPSPPPPANRAHLIAIDWGTSNLRASLLGGAGKVLETRAAAGGVMAVQDRRFEEALQSLCGDWIAAQRCPVVVSGMIGSRQGWQEAPYIECPASLAQAGAQLTRIALAGGGALHIVPGLRCVGADGQCDVMRGEETQLWGAGLPAGSCCVLPGTHSKWAWLGADDVVRGFQTFMTGELYAVLTQHSILGRLMQFGGHDAPAFEQGVRLGLAEQAGLTHALFAVRTAGLMGRIAPAALPDFLSGLLIGAEIGGATRQGKPTTVTLLGEDALCARYEAALGIAGIASSRAPADATTRGQWRVAAQAGLLEAGA